MTGQLLLQQPCIAGCTVAKSSCRAIAVSTRATNHKDSKMLDAWATLCGVNKDNDDLVHELEMHERLKSRRVADAMRKVPMQVSPVCFAAVQYCTEHHSWF